MSKHESSPCACMIETAPRETESFRDPAVRVRDREPVNRGLDEAAAVREAARCLGQRTCDGCDLCRYFCPDLCITRNKETGEIEIDYDFCKGCGICAAICPKGAISMVREE